MAILAQRKNVKTEELILTGMIISNDFFAGIRTVVSPDYFCNNYTSMVASWCIDFYNTNGEVPFDSIFHIFEAEKDKLAREDINVLSALFTRISDVYSENTDGFNHQYLLHDIAIPYFERRELENRANRMLGYLAKDDIEGAKAVLDAPFKMRESAITVVNPFDSDLIEEAIFSVDDPLFTFPGAIGKLFGPIGRGWFINLQGAFKRGKSNFLYDTAFHLAASGIKVYHVSLEMNYKDSILRWARRVTGAATEPGIKILPVFDCTKNQAGICDKPQAPVQPPLLDSQGSKPEYDIESQHKVCTACREEINLSGEYEPAVWFTPVEKSYVGSNHNLQLLETFDMYYGHNIRSVSYPKFSVSLRDIVRDMDTYTQDTGFIPQVLILDYADVTRLARHQNMRDSYDEVYKDLAGISEQRGMTTINVSQSNRPGINKQSMSEEDVAEDIRKLAHVDIFATLNQLPKEKRDKSARIALIAHRHREFDKSVQALILQDIEIGQFVLDSELVRVSEEN